MTPNVVQVPVKRGEKHRQRPSPHKNVVRRADPGLGAGWNGGAGKASAVPGGPAGLKTAILVQAGTGGPILAAAKGLIRPAAEGGWIVWRFSLHLPPANSAPPEMAALARDVRTNAAFKSAGFRRPRKSARKPAREFVRL